ncbi:MAG TPA: hypothetical protein VID29_10920 [Solirubrobacteraceae bacterium]|jgi:hypothetical protein
MTRVRGLFVLAATAIAVAIVAPAAFAAEYQTIKGAEEAFASKTISNEFTVGSEGSNAKIVCGVVTMKGILKKSLTLSAQPSYENCKETFGIVKGGAKISIKNCKFEWGTQKASGTGYVEAFVFGTTDPKLGKCVATITQEAFAGCVITVPEQTLGESVFQENVKEGLEAKAKVTGLTFTASECLGLESGKTGTLTETQLTPGLKIA